MTKNILRLAACVMVGISFSSVSAENTFTDQQSRLLKQTSSVKVKGESYYLLEGEYQAQYLGRQQSENTVCSSQQFPRNERYATGDSYLSFKREPKDTLALIYEWSSGHVGGSTSITVEEKNCNYFVPKIETSSLNGGARYTEKYNFSKSTYSTKYKKLASLKGDIVKGKKLEGKQEFHSAGYELQPSYGAKNIVDSADFSGTTSIFWEDKFLHFHLSISDENIVFGEGIHADHIEIWSAERVYTGKPITKLKGQRDNVKQFLINIINDKIVLTYGFPNKASYKSTLEGHVSRAENGYSLDFKIPYEEFFSGRRFIMDMGVEDFFNGDLLNMTVVVSDADERGKQESMIATSKLKYGNPSTFGRVLLLEKDDLPALSGYLLK